MGARGEDGETEKVGRRERRLIPHKNGTDTTHILNGLGNIREIISEYSIF